jgi:FkbM family methyltransferase
MPIRQWLARLVGSKPRRKALDRAVAILGARSTTVIDVGARGGLEGGWYNIAPLARLVGFEPDVEECRSLNERTAPGSMDVRYVPLALGKKQGRASLYCTKDPACSSLYPPDPAMQKRHPALSVIEHVATIEVELTTLEHWAKSESVDEVAFIKLDAQGSELDILEGAGTVLDRCLGLEVEVEFAPIYIGQPVFADIDQWLRTRGFTLWRLQHLVHYSEKPGEDLSHVDDVWFDHAKSSFAVGSGRLMWGNAVYFRDYRQTPPLDSRRLLILATLFEALGDADAMRGCLKRSGDFDV